MKALKLIPQFIDKLGSYGAIIAAFCLVLLTGLVFFSVLSRYFFGMPVIWVQEVSAYLFIAIGFLAAAYALEKGGHFSITFLVDKLRKINKARMQAFASLLGFVYCVVFFVKGIEMVAFSKEIKDVSTGLLAIPLWIPQLLIPIGSLLLCLQFLKQFLDSLKQVKSLKANSSSSHHGAQ